MGKVGYYKLLHSMNLVKPYQLRFCQLTFGLCTIYWADFAWFFSLDYVDSMFKIGVTIRNGVDTMLGDVSILVLELEIHSSLSLDNYSKLKH